MLQYRTYKFAYKYGLLLHIEMCSIWPNCFGDGDKRTLHHLFFVHEDKTAVALFQNQTACMYLSHIRIAITLQNLQLFLYHPPLPHLIQSSKLSHLFKHLWRELPKYAQNACGSRTAWRKFVTWKVLALSDDLKTFAFRSCFRMATYVGSHCLNRADPHAAEPSRPSTRGVWGCKLDYTHVKAISCGNSLLVLCCRWAPRGHECLLKEMKHL